MGDDYDVIMAGYPTVETAQHDFDELVALVKDKRVRTEGVILVEHDVGGRVKVSQTGDHLGRKGLGWGGGVGLVVGLFSPALLASIVVGAAAGGVVGKFAKHRVESGMETGLGDKLKPGSAAIVAMIDDDDRLAAERALAGTPAKSVATMDKRGVRGLKNALAEAVGKFVPDRTVLPIPDQPFGGTAGRTLRDSVADWSMIPGPKAPEGAPNVLVVLIDDAGFGSHRHLRRADQHAHLDPCATDGRDLRPLPRHRGLLADAGGTAYGAQPAPGRLRLDRRVSRPLSRLHRRQAAKLRAVPAHPEGERLRHRRVRQVAPDPRQRAGRGRPLRPLAHVVGLRPLVGLPLRRRRPVRPDHHHGQRDARRARGQGRQALLLPRRPHRQGGRVAARGACPGRREALDDVLLDRLRARAAPRRHRVGRQVQGQVRRGLGQAARGDPRAPEEARRRPADTELTERPDALPAWDSLADDAAEALRPPDGGLRRLPGERRLERRPPARRGRGDGRSRQHADLLHLGRQRRQYGGHAPPARSTR